MAMTTTRTSELAGNQDPDGPSDALLLDRVRQGDRDAYGELYVRHEPAATSLAVSARTRALENRSPTLYVGACVTLAQIADMRGDRQLAELDRLY